MPAPAILFSSTVDDPAPWRAAFAKHRPDLEFRIWPDTGDVADIRYALVWTIPDGLLKTLPHLRAIFSLGAGVDQILRDPAFPKAVPLYRLVDAGLKPQMTQYAVYGVLHWYREMARYAAQQKTREWKLLPATHPSERTVGVMGLGVFGTDIAEKLVALGFRVIGWSRTQKDIPGVECLAGAAAFDRFLGESEILVNVLPLTDATRGILGKDLFAKLPRGAALVHLGRGGHLREDDLIASLDSGQLGWAMLDVFPKEPLPQASPLWTHPKLLVTPHAAAQAIGAAAEDHVIATLNAFEAGKQPPGRVDPAIGY